MVKKIIVFIFILFIGIYLIPPSEKKFFELYNRKDEFSESLQSLRNQPLKKIDIEGKELTYLFIPPPYSEARVILFLHGMTGSYDIWWQQIEYFKSQYGIISFSLPEYVHTLNSIQDIILKILEKEKIDKIIVIGTSMGGYITQYLIKSIPHKIEKAVLSNTFPPNEEIEKENQFKILILKLIPEIIFSLFLEKNYEKILNPSTKNSDLLIAFLKSLNIRKKQFLNRYQIITHHFKIFPRKEEEVKIPKLIIISQNDLLVKETLRKKLIEIYPESKIYIFDNEGHFPYVVNSLQYNLIIEKFIKVHSL